MSSQNIFPKWINKLPLVILITVTLIGVSIILVTWYWFSPYHLNVGYKPKQPIPYSHKLHVGELGIDCRYCHSSVEVSHAAGIPPTETCMNCHKMIKKESPNIQKLKESYDSEEPIEWIKVHNMADYVYFDHSRHINSGVACVTCHGRVDQMKEVHQVQPLSMSWCLDCHRAPEKYIRPKELVTNMQWKSKNQEKTGAELVEKYHLNPREDCSACHR